ncbi:CDS3, putative relaxase (part of ICE) [Mycoplasma mycoides subsp. capri LC str. 95010]|uniref:CDS3, putative relaxase (Part of ICE) n=1 Tax=Mycoplasma mycoides subsp. capri LC str. 95010 TaxID=862259 RepID=F4MPA5_MYCML|nr:hypothetical protein [Mycoplasma mycoides]CBW53937.1 CDS3, putative relaxase (part of ICE) [Mycoplasma mycoides subsp. capri LC str. 95010]CBW54034.1 CDS3, putative relaxase (part of ICE) [Mycoplasma mycoides subsp. capri LC str. 95010]
MIVKLEFTNNSFNKKANKKSGKVHDFNFYSSGVFINYITRNNAVYVQNDDVSKEELIKEWQNSKLEFKDFIKTKTRKKQKIEDKSKTGLYRLFDESPVDIDLKKAKKILKKLNPNQNVWELVINPGQLGIDYQMIDKKEWNDILNKTTKNLFKVNNLNPNNMTGFWTIHTNTEFVHLHLCFFEKQADINNNFRTKGKFKKQSLERYSEIIKTHIISNKDYENLYQVKNEIWDSRKEIKNFFKDGIKAAFVEHSVKVIKEFFYKNGNNKNYSLTKDNKRVNEAVWDIFNYIKNTTPELKRKYKEYRESIENMKQQTFSSEQVNKLKNEFLDKEAKEFEQQIGNTIVKDCLNSNWTDIRYHSNSYSSFKPNKKKKSNLDYLVDKWKFEFNQIQFKKKMEALDKFNKNIRQKSLSKH